MLASNRRPSAVRRFPLGCGRYHNAAGRPPYTQLSTTAAAKTDPAPPNPSAPAATNTGAPPARRSLPTTASLGAEAPHRGVRNGCKAAAAVAVPRVSAVRRYPPGCGRGVALLKPKAPDSEGQVESEDGAGKPSAVMGNGDPKASACDGEVILRASALNGVEFNSNGGMVNGGDGAQGEGGGKPWEVSGRMAVPFLPWAQHERRSQRASG